MMFFLVLFLLVLLLLHNLLLSLHGYCIFLIKGITKLQG